MPLNPGYHAMILVLASSTTVEYGIRSIYENSVGRTSWFLAGEQPTEEDRFSAEVAQEYVDFIRQQPWYLFDFQARLERLWNDVPWWGPDMLRKWERRYLLTSEYLVKAAYGKLIEKATRAAYEVASMDTQVVIDPPPTVLTLPPRTTVLRSLNNGQRVLSLPRYFDFRLAATALAKQGVEFSDIAGNDGDILVTIWLPDDVAAPPLPGRELFTQALQIPADIRRVGMLVKVRDLASFLNLATARNITVEHVHDY
ncbi:hypothetical protein SB11R_07120 [Pseudomonas oryzihabitans]|nr:hypothetical protein SB11R_07120 [Pseudomonas psychrotolerans]KTT59712.1 hypothetical protein SB8_03425 [Pseudomonas psychrotolerans]